MRPELVLLVEDEAPKRRHISEHILTTFNRTQLDVAGSVTAAISKLEVSRYDLVLLDMTLPTFDQDEHEPGGRPQGFGGIEVIRYVSMADVFVPIIVLTGYEVFPGEAGTQMSIEQLSSMLGKEFGEGIIQVIHYSSAVDEWKKKLNSAIEEMQ